MHTIPVIVQLCMVGFTCLTPLSIHAKPGWIFARREITRLSNLHLWRRSAVFCAFHGIATGPLRDVAARGQRGYDPYRRTQRRDRWLRRRPARTVTECNTPRNDLLPHVEVVISCGHWNQGIGGRLLREAEDRHREGSDKAALVDEMKVRRPCRTALATGATPRSMHSQRAQEQATVPAERKIPEDCPPG